MKLRIRVFSITLILVFTATLLLHARHTIAGGGDLMSVSPVTYQFIQSEKMTLVK